MSKQDVRKYFEMLEVDDEFARKVIDTGEDKEAKMKLIKAHNMCFTKEEFIEVANEYKGLLENESELDDKVMESIAGGFILGGIVGAGVGAIVGACVGTAGSGVGACAYVTGSGGIFLPAVPITTMTGMAVGALTGMIAGGTVGALIPFV